MPTRTEADDYADEPLYWFALLDHAVQQGDHEAAADAQRQLKRLGVRVRYGRPRKTASGPGTLRLVPAESGVGLA
jgi:hypothetical protein